MSEKVIYYGNELYHFGIKGQKWGERKYQYEDGSLTPEGRIHYGYGSTKERLVNAKGMKKAASRAYDKSFNNAYSKTFPIHLTKKGRDADNARWAKAQEDLDKYHAAKKEYKEAKKEYKEARKNAYEDVKNKTTLKDKFTYNKATFKSTAKKMVDFDMSYEEALTKTKKEAWRNTAIYSAVVAGLTVAELYAMNKK